MMDKPWSTLLAVVNFSPPFASRAAVVARTFELFKDADLADGLYAAIGAAAFAGGAKLVAGGSDCCAAADVSMAPAAFVEKAPSRGGTPSVGVLATLIDVDVTAIGTAASLVAALLAFSLAVDGSREASLCLMEPENGRLFAMLNYKHFRAQSNFRLKYKHYKP